MAQKYVNSFATRKALKVGSESYDIFSLPQLEQAGFKNVSRLPISLKILLENLLRQEDNHHVNKADIEALANWKPKAKPDKEIAFMPARVLMQDLTGVPAVVDLAAMREAMTALLHKVQLEYPHPEGAYWVPRRLGGSAPTLEEAKALDEAELAERARRRAEREAKSHR